MRILAAVLSVALAIVAAPAHAQEVSPAAKQVLAQARAASGGKGWNTLRGWRETGLIGTIRYEAWVDPLRYGLRIETHEAEGLRVRGFNGAGDWQISPAGVTTGVDDRLVVAEARTNAFFRANLFFFPGRFAARGEHLGVRQHQGRAFDVLSIQPMGGKPRELWFDRRTHLLGRMVDRSGARPTTVEYSDYRRAGPIQAAFTVTIDNGVQAGVERRQIQTLTFAPADRGIFSLQRRATQQTATVPPRSAPQEGVATKPSAAKRPPAPWMTRPRPDAAPRTGATR